MPSPAEIFSDSDFRSSARESQRQRLIDLDPKGFGNMGVLQQESIIEQGLEQFEPGADYGDAFQRGIWQSAASAAHLSANIVDFIPGLESVEEELRGLAETASGYGEPREDETTGEMYARIMGSVPLSLGMAMGFVGVAGKGLGAIKALKGAASTLAPIVGFGSLGALSASDQGPGAALKAGIMEGAFGAMFPGTQHLRRAYRSGILGGTAYAMTPEEMEFSERLGHGLTMAVMAGIPARRAPIKSLQKLGVKDRVSALTIDEKLLAEMKFREETESLAHARDQQKQQSEQTTPEKLELPEPPSRDGSEGTGDLSGEATRGRLNLPEAEVLPLVVEVSDVALNNQGVPKYSKVGELPKQPGKNFQEQKEVQFSEDLPVKIMKASDIFNTIGKLFFPIRLGKMRGDPKGAEGVHYPPQEGTIATGGKPWHDFSGFSSVRRFHDVLTAAHEFGHMLSRWGKIQESMHNSPEAKAFYARNPKISDLPPWLQELHHISYRVASAEEGFAEMIRHWLTNQRYAQERAPEAVKLFESTAKSVLTKKQLKGLYKLREQVHRWYDQGATATLASKIGGSQIFEDALHGRGARNRELMFDDLQGGLELVRILGIELPDSFYEHIRLLKGTGMIAEGMPKFGVLREVADPKRPGETKLEFDGEGSNKIMKPIIGKGQVEWDAFWRMAVALQARELKGQIRLPGGKVVEKEGASIIDRMLGKEREIRLSESEIKAGEALQTPERMKVYEGLKDYRKRVVDFMIQMGVINEKQRLGWMRKEFVFSFLRQMETGRQGRGRTLDSLANSNGIYQLHGHSGTLRDPFFSFTEGVNKQIEAALRNRAMLRLVDIGQAAGRVTGKHYGPEKLGVAGAGAFFKKIPERPEIVHVGARSLISAYKRELKQLFHLEPAELEAAMKWLGDHPADIDQLSIFLGHGKPYGSDVLTVLRQGVPEYYEIQDPMLLRTLENLSRPAQKGMVAQMGKLKKLKQGFIVVEPSFMFANFVRDIAMATIMTRTGNQHLTAALNGLRHVWKQDKTYQDFIANGGGGSTMRDNLHITKARLMRHKGGMANPQNMVVTFADVVRVMETVGRGLENASRVGEYARGRRKGMSASHAAFLAREVSTDFSLRGGNQGILGFANTTIPFFSAMLAGADRGYRAMFRDPTGKFKTVMKIGIVANASAVLYGLNKQLGATFGDLKDEDGRQMVDFNNLPQWSKTAYWHWYIPTDFSPETGAPTKFTHFHMPKLWEVGAIATWAELFVESMQGGDEDDRSLAKDFLQVAAGNFNINLIEEGFLLPLPAGVDLLAEQMTNKILFTGSPIETAGMESLQHWQRARSGQAQTMKKWGELFKGDLGDYVPAFIKSPARAEALLRGITGNWGAMALQVIDSGLFPGGPQLGLDDYPIVRRIYSQAGKYDRNVQSFYENLREFNQAYGTMRNLSKKGDVEAMNEMSLDQDQMDMVGMSPGFDRINRQIQLMNREIGLIRDGAVMNFASGAEKSSAINRIQALRNQLMKQMNSIAQHYRNR